MNFKTTLMKNILSKSISTLSKDSSNYFCKFNQDKHSTIDPFKIYNTHNAWGILTSIDVSNCDYNLIRDKKYIRNFVQELCDLIDMKSFGPLHIQYFGSSKEVEGYSIFQFIETSCLSGHFSNKKNSSYIDVFSCKPYDPKIAAMFTAKSFKSDKYKYSILLRR